MPTGLKRVNLSVPQDLYETLVKDSDLESRAVAGQVVHILKIYYSERRKEADLFMPSRLREGKKEPPVFEYPSRLPTERESKLRETLGREKS